jgi:hypothetical protein
MEQSTDFANLLFFAGVGIFLIFLQVIIIGWIFKIPEQINNQKAQIKMITGSQLYHNGHVMYRNRTSLVLLTQPDELIVIPL